MSTYSYSDLVTLNRNAGFSDAGAATMAAIMLAESGGQSNAVGDGGTSVGLAQIHLPAHPGVTSAQASDPATAAKLAFSISNGGTNFSPWSQFTNGTYKNFLGGGTSASTTASHTGATGSSIAPAWGTFGKWALGTGVVAAVLLAGAENPKTHHLAVLFAGLVATTAAFKWGPVAWSELTMVIQP